MPDHESGSEVLLFGRDSLIQLVHSLNNSIAYGVTIHEAWVPLALGPLVLLGCVLVPRAQRVAMA